MKKSALFFSSLLFFIQIYAQVKSDLEQEHIAGKVKSITGSRYIAEEQFFVKRPDGSVVSIELYGYNNKGYVEMKKILTPNGKQTYTTYFFYDGTGHKIEADNYNENDKLLNGSVYENDAAGNMIKETYYSPPGTIAFYNLYTYDSRGNQTAEYHNTDKSPDETYAYDQDNKMIEKDLFNDGKLDTKYVYIYDAFKRKTQEIQYYKSDDIRFKTYYEYNLHGKLAKESIYEENPTELYGEITYLFDADGNNYEKDEYWPTMGDKTYKNPVPVLLKDPAGTVVKGDFQGKQVSTYNTTGDIVLDESYTKNNVLSYKGITTFNSDQIESGEKFYKEPGDTLVSYSKLFYDSKNNLVKCERYSASDTMYAKSVYVVDENRVETGEKYYNGAGELESNDVYKYDGKGNLIEDDLYDGAGKIKDKTTYSYDGFDSFGNWTRRISYHEGKPTQIKEREIEYY